MKRSWALAVTQQDYPTPAVETKILSRVAESLSIDDPKFIVHLVTWAVIRKTYDDGGVDAVITTRRLINILKAFAIWGMWQVDWALHHRFDDEHARCFTHKVSGDYNDKPELDYIANPELNSEHELPDSDVLNELQGSQRIQYFCDQHGE